MTQIQITKENFDEIVGKKYSLIDIQNLDIVFNPKLQKLTPIKIGNHEFLVNSRLGYYPYFTMDLFKRIKQKKANNITINGEGGIGKTYMGSDICRNLSRRFDVDDIVFRYVEFMRCVLTSPRGVPIEFDEPSYAMSKRDWYNELNKALVKTIESFRFKGKPLFIPIINNSLLDSDVRKHLLQYQIVVKERGKATAYRLFPDQVSSRLYRYTICDLEYGLYDNNLCDKDSCLTCNKLDPKDTSKRCMLFRSRYERKKMKTQEERYQEAIEEAEKTESENLSLDEIESKVIQHFNKFFNFDKNIIDINLLATVLKREFDPPIVVGHNKIYRLRSQIEYDHPELFPEPPEINKETVEKELEENGLIEDSNEDEE